MWKKYRLFSFFCEVQLRKHILNNHNQESHEKELK